MGKVTGSNPILGTIFLPQEPGHGPDIMPDPNSQEALDALRHSCAHVMAQAVQELFPGTKITIGPAIENGFYYDFDSPHRFTEEDFNAIEQQDAPDRRGQPRFRPARKSPTRSRRNIGRSAARPYKLEILEEFKDQKLTHYTHSTFTDLCRGGHTPSTKPIRHFKLLSVAGAYWRGDEKNAMLQRIYATAWPTKDQLTAHLKMLEEAKNATTASSAPPLTSSASRTWPGPA